MAEENLPNNEEQPQKPPVTKEQIEEWLRTEPRFQSYFEGFQPWSVESFMDSYATYKKMWLDYGQMYIDRNASAETQWIEEAAAHLKYILQKKLFDAQCLWRAEQATYEGVEICYDFQVWETNILNCPFLEPITEAEIELYQQFLNSNNVYLEEMDDEDWQEYEDIKEAYATDDGNRNFPEWYDFHNGRTGAGVYMTLPDIRGAKEEGYRDLFFEKQRAEKAEEWAEYERTRDKRPTLFFSDKEQVRYFVTTFEDARTRELYEAFEHSNRHAGDREELERTIRFLLDTDELISIERHSDFREALREAAQRYRLRKISEHLPLAYEEYLMNRSLGLQGATDNRYRRDDLRELWGSSILAGRKLAGEPEDFDF